jgi:hypothetical protein
MKWAGRICQFTRDRKISKVKHRETGVADLSELGGHEVGHLCVEFFGLVRLNNILSTVRNTYISVDPK